MQKISVYRRRCDGKLALVREFENFDEFFKTVGHLYESELTNVFDTNPNVRRLIHPFSWDNQRDRALDGMYVVYPYVVFDNHDHVVTVERLLGMYRAYRKELHKDRVPKYMIAQLRNPGHKMGGGYCYYRAIRTTNERRWTNAWDDEEFAPKPRSSRNLSNLRDSYDDPCRSDCRNKSWKRHRKHQWKEGKTQR